LDFKALRYLCQRTSTAEMPWQGRPIRHIAVSRGDSSAWWRMARRRAGNPARGGHSTHEWPHTSHPLATTAPHRALATAAHRAATLPTRRRSAWVAPRRVGSGESLAGARGPRRPSRVARQGRRYVRDRRRAGHPQAGACGPRAPDRRSPLRMAPIVSQISEAPQKKAGGRPPALMLRIDGVTLRRR